MTMNVLNNVVEGSKKNMHLFILAIYAYVLFQIEDNDFITMILLTVAACLSICYIKKGSVKKLLEGMRHESEEEGEGGGVEEGEGVEKEMPDGPPQGARETRETKEPAVKQPVEPPVEAPVEGPPVEGFENAPQIMNQLPDMMGPYDGLCLQTGNKQSWMKTPDETALVPNDALFTYLSSQGPTKPVFTDNSALTGPSVDGHPASDKKMFMLANNRTSPNCCPSTFSTSTGCVCTTKNQRDFIASRGGSTLKQRKTADLQDI